MNSLNILIVDDIVVNRILLVEIVKQLQHNYFEARNGKEAIQIIEEKKIDLVLMDIEMPVMNGLETTKMIRKELKKTVIDFPIVALTAHNPNDFFSNFSDVGFNDLICKPYLIEKITDTIQKFYP
jgi:two-component system, response regulator, stage 0 sporulation protein F